MAETSQFGLPLLAAAQAQKHVTVNEALARLDALAQIRITSTAATPPASPVDGEAHVVAAGASGEWVGRDGQLAIFANGGWIFVAPKAGWTAWHEGEGRAISHDGTGWQPGALTVATAGAATLGAIAVIDQIITSGTTVTVPAAIPGNAVVVGVTGRVLTAISGAGVTGWRLGVAGSENRYGSGLGLAVGSYALGLTGGPMTYYAATDLVIAAEGGSFDGGAIRIAVHHLQLTPPAVV